MKVGKINSIIAENNDGTIEFRMDNLYDTTLLQEEEYFYNGKSIDKTLWRVLNYVNRKKKESEQLQNETPNSIEVDAAFVYQSVKVAYQEICTYIETLLDEEQ